MKVFLPFEEAKALIKAKNLKGVKEWKEFCFKKLRPNNIPSDPDRYYQDKGWVNWMDFLGTTNVSTSTISSQFLSFESAKTFVQTLGLKNIVEWQEYVRSGNKPSNIPSNPNISYQGKGWVDFADFIGNTKYRHRKKNFYSYPEASVFLINNGVTTWKKWVEYSKAGKRPPEIPQDPYVYYGKRGEWTDWETFLTPVKEKSLN